jgi:hypothetical protein
MIWLCLLCLLPFVIGFVRNGGNINIPRSPKVGP